ncbi:MAG: helix-turn-helix transcriptional regulator [Clostridiales bacterium]|nr:helix-turn-helix transcriptional regulator [Clostridiales bacterium]
MVTSLEYDLYKFGNILYNLRTKNKLTKANIRIICGLNPDTLRKMELGYTIPKHDTLIKLSEIYNINLDNILDSCKYHNDESINSIREKINEASYDDDLQLIESLIKEIKTLQTNKKLPHHLSTYIKQLEYLIELTKLKNKVDISSAMISQQTCYSALRMTKKGVTKANISDYLFSPLESRFLLALALSKSRLNEIESAIKITNIAIENLKLHYEFNSKNSILLIQGYYHLAHFNFLLDSNHEVIKYCEEGINLSREMSNMKLLPYIYFRKGIAEFELGQEFYINTLEKSLMLLEVQNLNDLKETFITSLLTNYDIKIPIR